MIFCFFIMVQLIVESLPISSSGHVALFHHLLRAPAANFFSDTFMYMIHGPTIILLAIFFRKQWFALLAHPWRCRFIAARLLLFGFCAEVPTLFWFMFFKNNPIPMPLWGGFLITALMLVSLVFTNRIYKALTWWKAFIIGCAQGISLLPGISRFGSTYVLGRHCGLSPRTAFAFSFTIEWPLILIAFCKGLYDARFMGYPVGLNASEFLCIAIGSVISYMVLCVVYTMAVRHTLWHWGIYMTIPLLAALLI